MAVTASDCLSCTKCGGSFPEEGFDRNRLAKHRNGRHQWCKSCRRENLQARYQTDPEKYREFARWGSTKHRYGLTRADYEVLSAQQGDACRICRESDQRRLCVDHDHACCPGQRSCGKCIRGLLCSRCNRLLGMVRDNPDLLRAAVAYLEG